MNIFVCQVTNDVPETSVMNLKLGIPPNSSVTAAKKIKITHRLLELKYLLDPFFIVTLLRFRIVDCDFKHDMIEFKSAIWITLYWSGEKLRYRIGICLNFGSGMYFLKILDPDCDFLKSLNQDPDCDFKNPQHWKKYKIHCLTFRVQKY